MTDIKEAFQKLLKDNDAMIKNPSMDEQLKMRLTISMAIIGGAPFVVLVDGVSAAAVSPAEIPPILEAMEKMKKELKKEFQDAADHVAKI